jgi:hypothetical protein
VILIYAKYILKQKILTFEIMGKPVNKELREKLVFNYEEIASVRGAGKQIIISTTYDNIYRQYSYYDNGSNQPAYIEQYNEEAKNIITHSIDDALELKRKMKANECMTKEETEKCRRLGL